MAPVTNGRVIFNNIPQGFPELDKTVVYDTSETIDLDAVALHGGLLVKTLELSIDPYMRTRMRPAGTESYIGPFEIGRPLDGYGIGIVLRSEHKEVKAGEHVYGFLDHTEYSIVKDLSWISVLQNPHKLSWSTFLGPLGMPGQTAWMAWKEFSKAKKGETVFVSTGAGPVGSFVIQLAKLDGLKVIASAGSEEKVQFLKDIGADVAFNYKTVSTKEVLEREGGIDIYWDHVGHVTLDAALEAAHKHARIIACGMISCYNSGNAEPVKNLLLLVNKSLTMHGFIVLDLIPKYLDTFNEEVPELVLSGKIKYREQRWNGLEKVGEAILAVQRGENKAKAVIHVADE